MTDFLVCFSTASSMEEAEKIARNLVAGGAAACVNIVPSCLSIYEWKGEAQRDSECLMLIKSTNERFEKVVEIVERHHSYEVPEVIATDLERVSDRYGAYLRSYFK